MKGSSRSCVTGSVNRATLSPCITIPRFPFHSLTHFVGALFLISLIQFDSKRGRLLVHLSFSIHISQVNFEGVPGCVPSFFFPSVCLFPILFCNDMLNLALRTMRDGCSTSSVVQSFFRNSIGLPLAAVCPNDANLWVNAIKRMKPFAADGNKFTNACRKKQEQTSSQNETKLCQKSNN